MIVVRLMGGLGNQMFQYATARRAAHANNTALKLDLGWFRNHARDSSPYPLSSWRRTTYRRYELGCYNIVENFATEQEVAALVPKRCFDAYVPGRVRGILRSRNSCYVGERTRSFEARVLRVGDGVYLDGYWMSEKYFCDIADLLTREYTIRGASSPANEALAELIGSVNAVSLHVRRGDYVTNHVTNSYHGVCPLDYYHLAASHIAHMMEKPHFFVFSDDPDWVRANLTLSAPTVYVEENDTDTGYEDMRLMALCKHNIIANSTFSWWGAWLNRNPAKIVYAPRKWFSAAQTDMESLLPPSWRLL
jgi:hypothetical protein